MYLLFLTMLSKSVTSSDFALETSNCLSLSQKRLLHCLRVVSIVTWLPSYNFWRLLFSIWALQRLRNCLLPFSAYMYFFVRIDRKVVQRFQVNKRFCFFFVQGFDITKHGNWRGTYKGHWVCISHVKTSGNVWVTFSCRILQRLLFPKELVQNYLGTVYNNKPLICRRLAFERQRTSNRLIISKQIF